MRSFSEREREREEHRLSSTCGWPLVFWPPLSWSKFPWPQLEPLKSSFVLSCLLNRVNSSALVVVVYLYLYLCVLVGVIIGQLGPMIGGHTQMQFALWGHSRSRRRRAQFALSIVRSFVSVTQPLVAALNRIGSDRFGSDRQQMMFAIGVVGQSSQLDWSLRLLILVRRDTLASWPAMQLFVQDAHSQRSL